MSTWHRNVGGISVAYPLQDREGSPGAESRGKSAPHKLKNYSRYMKMLLELDEIPWWHNALASLCTWLLLAGYVVLPGAFTSIGNSRVLSEGAGAAGKAVVKAAKTWPLLLVASICCAIGVSGIGWLWYTWRRNYVWLLNKIIVPGMLNSFAGLIATVTNIYTARNKYWSRTAIVTAAITGTCASILMILFFIHYFWNLRHVKEEHERFLEAERQAEREAEKLETQIEGVTRSTGCLKPAESGQK